MTFLSYAQNFEDVLLWRALGHIAHGFYVDVGANDPVEHSVTKAFYDAGWRGINIEPLPAFHQAFVAQRPRDINLAIAAGASDGSLTLYDVPAVNGWASPDAAVAEAHRAEGYEVSTLTVPVRTLAGVCAEHARGDIHFLKIDVEGFEGEVLRGMDFATFRPWLLVVEATLPNSRVSNHAAWEALITTHGYAFVWFDGLNRYYVSPEHGELRAAFGVQPNVFDAFISHHLDKAWRANEAAAAAAVAAERRIASLGEQQWKAEQRAERAEGVSHQALDHAHELLLKYEDAEKRTLQTTNTLAVVRADSELLRASLARAGADLAGQARQLVDLEQRGIAERAELQRLIDQAWAESHAAAGWGQEMEQRLLAMLASRSWRMTRPVRGMGTLLRRLRGPGLRVRALLALRPLLTTLTRNETLRRLLIPLMRRLPDRGMGLSQAINTIKQADPATLAALAEPAPVVSAAAPAAQQRHLPQSARRVLADLQRASTTVSDREPPCA